MLGRSVRFYFLIVLVFSKGHASSTGPFLSYEQFQSLPTTYQIEYIGDLQKLVVDLSANEQLTADERLFLKGSVSSLLAALPSLLPLAAAVSQAPNDSTDWNYWQRDAQCRLKSARGLSNTDLLSSIEQLRNCREIGETRERPGFRFTTPQYYYPSTAERILKLSEELKRRMQAGMFKGQQKFQSQEAAGTLRAAISGFRETPPRFRGNYETFLEPATQVLSSLPGGTRMKPKPPSVPPQPAATGASPRLQATVIPAKSPDTRPEKQPLKSPEKPPVKSPAKPVRTSPAIVAPSSVVLPRPPAPVISPRPSAAPVKMEAASPSSPGQVPSVSGRMAVAANTISSSPPLSESGYQCLYAGFLIPKTETKCRAYQKLPAHYVGDFFDADQFLCPQPTDILCNPLVFGYEPNCGSDVDTSCKAQKPLCIRRSRDATKHCWELSEKKQTRPQVLKIWQSPQGPAAYESLIRNLIGLCDPAQLEKRNLRALAKADIEKTCALTFKAMEQNLKDKFLPNLGPLQKLQEAARARSSH